MYILRHVEFAVGYVLLLCCVALGLAGLLYLVFIVCSGFMGFIACKRVRTGMILMFVVCEYACAGGEEAKSLFFIFCSVLNWLKRFSSAQWPFANFHR